MASRTFNNSVVALTASDITEGFTVTLNKKGNMIRVDCGANSSNPPACTSGVNKIGVLPFGSRPLSNIYFPVLYRIPNDNTFYSTYGALYANGDISICLVQAVSIRQLVLGQTFFGA